MTTDRPPVLPACRLDGAREVRLGSWAMTGPSETNAPRDWTGAFVLSSGRSGSTMLSDILASHPDIASLSEVLTYLGTRSLLPGRV